MISQRVITLSFFLMLGFALTAFGQEIERNSKEAYFEVGKGDYIKEWLLLGPFPSQSEGISPSPAPLSTIWRGAGGEVRPYDGMTITAPDGKSYTWKRYKSQGNVINLIDALGQHDNTIVYATCNILSGKDQRLEMLVGEVEL